MDIKTILKQFGIQNPTSAEPFICQEDNSEYNVWKITASGKNYVLKKPRNMSFVSTQPSSVKQQRLFRTFTEQ